jgi:hypothetical protein
MVTGRLAARASGTERSRAIASALALMGAVVAAPCDVASPDGEVHSAE